MLFYMPTKLYSESQCVKNHGKELTSLGTKAMIVTGKHSSRANGSLQDVENVLKSENVSYVIYNEIEENPSVETIMSARAIGMAITHTGTSLPHGLSYPLTYELGLPHGKAVGIFLAGYIAQYNDKKEVDTVLRILGFENTIDFQKYMKELLGATEVSDTILEVSAEAILKDAGKLKNYPFTITKQELVAMAEGTEIDAE